MMSINEDLNKMYVENDSDLEYLDMQYDIYSDHSYEKPSKFSFPNDIKIDEDALSLVKIEDSPDNYNPNDWVRYEINEEYRPSILAKYIESILTYNKVKNNKPPFYYFYLFLDRHLIELIVRETNEYARQYIINNKQYFESFKYSRYTKWKETDENEIKTYIGAILYMTILNLPDLDNYWEKNTIFETKLGQYISRNRFEIISKFLHLCNNEKKNKDRLFKVREYCDHITSNFKRYCQPGIFLTIDEYIIPFQGRFSLKQFIRNKPHQWGIKVFPLCCSRTSYCFDFMVYEGKNSEKKYPTFAEEVIFTLMEDYVNQNKILITDNYYSSPMIAIKLLEKKTGFIGTLRYRRLKKNNIIRERIPAGARLVFHNKNLRLLQFNDDRTVTILSTVHAANFIEEQNTLEYIKGFCHNYEYEALRENYIELAKAVDRCNQYLAYHMFRRTTLKWWKYIFYYGLGLMVHNSYLIYSALSEPKISQTEYIKEVVNHLLSFSEKKKKKDHKYVRIFPNKLIDYDLSCIKCGTHTTYTCKYCRKIKKFFPICKSCFIDHY